MSDLRRFFRPASIAVVGAKERSIQSYGVVEALARIGFRGNVFPVSRSGGLVHGRPAARCCTEIGEPIDMAVVLTPAAAVGDVLEDVAAAGIGGAVVLASGWGETGAGGRQRQDALVDQAGRLGLTLLGPNCLGFMNFSAATGAWIAAMPPHVTVGAVALLSQSGGIGAALSELAAELGVGLSHLVTTGNEASVTSTDVLGYLVDDDATAVIAMFVEGIRDAAAFRVHVDRAARFGKAVVVFKAGTSALTARNALSHTGALVGDDAVIDAAFRQHGVVRVRSLEELVVTAGLIAHTGPLARPGIAVVSISGGACDIVADDAERSGLPLPAFDDASRAALRDVLPPFASIHNPLDVTGGSLDGELADVLAIVEKQDDIGAIAVVAVVPPFASCKLPAVQGLLDTMGRAMASVSKPAVAMTQTAGQLNAFGAAALAEAGVTTTLPGLAHGVTAMRNLSWWSAQLRRVREGARTAPPDGWDTASGGEALSEWRSRELLAAAGVPCVPAVLAADADAAVRAAATWPGPVAVKLVSAELTHKSDVGAVRLGVDGPDAVRAAYDAVLAAGAGVRVDGVLVSPMRTGGVELLVGVSVDPSWGPVLAVGLGGTWVEVLGDVAMRLLPVTAADVMEMLGELQGSSLLRGGRGAPPVSTGHLVEAILAVSAAACALGPSLVSLEVNPLVADGGGAEALDALVVLRQEVDR